MDFAEYHRLRLIQTKDAGHIDEDWDDENLEEIWDEDEEEDLYDEDDRADDWLSVDE
jgi:hypothetical protein